MRQIRPFAFMVAALLLSAAHLAAQCEPAFSFSVYDDGSVSADGSTVYGYTSTEDTSTLCSCVHSDYEAYAILYAPDGSEIGEDTASGFEASVSAPTNAVSGTYEAAGAGTAYCSCLEGYFGGGGSDVPLTVQCPETISVSSTTGQFPFNASLPNNFPSWLTGFGMKAYMQVAPDPPTGTLNGTMVTESVTFSSSSCGDGSDLGSVFYYYPGGGGTPAPNLCVGSSTFTVGPSGAGNAGGNAFGTAYSGAGTDQFIDTHVYALGWDMLGQSGAPSSCTVTCAQTYSACGKTIGRFTISAAFTHTSISGTPITEVAITK